MSITCPSHPVDVGLAVIVTNSADRSVKAHCFGLAKPAH
jgi:hypothetical protein